MQEEEFIYSQNLQKLALQSKNFNFENITEFSNSKILVIIACQTNSETEFK